MENLIKTLLILSFTCKFSNLQAMENAEEDYHKAIAASLDIPYNMYKEGLAAVRQSSADSSGQVPRIIPRPRKELPTITMNNQLSTQFSYGKERETLQHFKEVFDFLQSVVQDSNVHNLDSYVAQNVQRLLNVGRLYNIDVSTLTLAQVGIQMSDFVSNNPQLFGNFKYVETQVSSANILSYLHTHFNSMDTEIGFDGAREVWSRSWTLALKLYQEYQDFKYMQIIYEQAIEDYLTGGGSLGGRINRGFVAYVRLLAAAGVFFSV